MSELPIINGVPYPEDVVDLDSLNAWIARIERPFLASNSATTTAHFYSYATGIRETEIINHREIFRKVPFFDGDMNSKRDAEAQCCKYIAAEMYNDIVRVPSGTVIIRIPPEMDVSYETTIPADLSLVKSRDRLEKEGVLQGNRPINLESVLPDDSWAVDFCTDAILKVGEHSRQLRQMKIYARYSCAVLRERKAA